MVIDSLNNLVKYVSLNPLIEDVLDFMKTNDLMKMENGQYLINDHDLFVNITTTKGRAKEDAILETHIKMIDIQIPLSCEETYGFSPLKDLPSFEYNEDKDCTLYDKTTPQTYFTLKPGQMVIFFPQDGHAPCISENSEIKKAIFKVKI